MRRAPATDQRARPKAEDTRVVLGQRLSVAQLLVIAPRLALSAVPTSSAAEICIHGSGRPAVQASRLRPDRRAVSGEAWRDELSHELTAEDGAVLGRLVMFCDRAGGFDAASRTAVSALAVQLQKALRRAESADTARAPHPLAVAHGRP